MIKLNNVGKEFNLTRKQQKKSEKKEGFVKAVDNVSFECKPGRVFSILGPNGAGKSTILRMISTLLKPSQGNIEVNGYDTVKDSEEVRKGIGFLTGTTGLYERLTPAEIITYFAKLYGIHKAEYKTRMNELFDKLNIHEFAHKKIGQLSTGMRQKVSIVRTMIHNPDVVVFDEPTTGLDVITAKSIIELIKSSKEEGKTVIFSSHIMSEVDLLCDDLFILHKGNMVYNGTMEEYRKNMQTVGLTEEFIRLINEFEENKLLKA